MQKHRLCFPVQLLGFFIIAGWLFPLNFLNAQPLLYIDDEIRSSAEITLKGSLHGESGTFNNNGIMRLSGDWTNNSGSGFLFSSANTGEVIFNGDTVQEITGSSSTAFYDLTLDNSGLGLQLGQDISVLHHLTLSAGELDLQNSIVDLEASGTLENETPVNRVKVGDPAAHKGTIRSEGVINDTTVSPGKLGIEISTTEDLGITTVIRGHEQLQGTGSNTSDYSICRYYDIIPATSHTAELRFYYWDDELTEGSTIHSESNLKMYRYTDDGSGGNWKTLPTTVDTSGNYAEAITNGFSEFTLAGTFDPSGLERPENNSSGLTVSAIYPNPAEDHIAVDLIAMERAGLDLLIFDSQGRQVIGKNVEVYAGKNVLKVDIRELPRALYLIRIVSRNSGQTVEKRFVK
ncbi:MAG: T9SS type A sorting domain-containing protein [Bacteroidales bacterium]